MKTLLPILSSLAFLIASPGIASFSSSNYYNFSFSTEVRTQFYPGESISFNLDLWGGYKKNEVKKYNFDIKVYHITSPDSFYLARTNNDFDILGKDSINLLKYCSEVWSDYRSVKFHYKNYSYESEDSIYIGSLPKGVYLIKVSSGTVVSYAGFIVSSLNYITKRGDNTLLAYVADGYSGIPVSNIDITCYKDKEIFASGKTSSGVFFSVNVDTMTLKKNEKDFLIIGKNNDDIFISDGSIFFGSLSRNITSYIFTNQPVYRTNSLVQFKGIMTYHGYNRLSSFSEKDIIVKITGPRSTEIYNDTLKTNQNGSFDGSVFIKDEYPIGNYSIKVTHEGKNAGSGSFEINQYKKPEYTVKVNPGKVRYGGDDILKATVTADYYFGSPVTDGEVTYSIFKTTYYKPWWSFSPYSWWYDETESDILRGIGWWYKDEKIYEGKGELDSEGKFEIKYVLDEDFKEKYSYYGDNDRYYETDYRYMIYATVSDKSRRNINGASSVFVTRGEYFLNSRTSKYFYKSGDRAYIDIGSYNFEDKPVSAKYEVNIYKIYYRNWEEDDKKPVKYLIGMTDEKGKGRVNFEVDSKFSEGYYRAEIISIDKMGNEVTTTNDFTVYKNKPLWYWYDETSSDINIITDRDEYFAGDTCRALVSIPDSNVNVLITAEAGDIKYHNVELFNTTVKYIEFVLDSTFNSNFTINAAYIFRNEQHTGSANVTFIPKEKFLNVEIETADSIYRPGDSSAAKIIITDHHGEPVRNAEVSLGVIDESIYYIKGDETGDIRKSIYKNRSSVYSYHNDFSQVYNYGSRYQTIFDRYEYINGKYDENLILVKGILVGDDSELMGNTDILLNDNIVAGTTDQFGYFMFRVPAGLYSLGIENSDYKMSNLTTFSIGNEKFVEMVLFKDKEKNTPDNIKLMKDKYDMQNYGTGVIEGKVIDGNDSSPLAGALISVEGTNIGVVANENGEFSINSLIPGKYNIVIYYIGYGEVKVIGVEVLEVSKNSYFVIELLPEGEVTTDVVEIRVDRTEIDVDQSGRIVSYEQLENDGLRGIENIVSVTTGVVTDERGQHINIRGTRSDENTIIVDGVSTAYVPDDLMNEIFLIPTVRKDFRDAIEWSPFITTDENGIASIYIKYPDNLTSWRFTSRVITEDRKVGEQRANVITRKDLLIRAEAPRFFRETDEVTITTIVHNYLDTKKRVKVFVKGENLFVKDNTEKIVEIKPNSDVAIDWNVRVLNSYGSAKLYAEALTDEESDAMEVLLPLEPKGLKETIVNQLSTSDMYSLRDEKAVISLESEINTAEMLISVSPSLASVMFTSLEYLIGYPYGCTEQTISRFIPLLIMSGVYDSLGIPFNRNVSDRIPDMVNTGLLRLVDLQKGNGGWGWWKNDDFDPLMSSYVITGLSIAKKQGYNVNARMYSKGIKKLFEYISDTEDNYEKANVIYAISTTGDNPGEMESIIDEINRSELSIYEMALLALSYKNIGRVDKAAELLGQIEVKRKEFQGMIYWSEDVETESSLRTDDVLTTAFVLKAYMNINPESSLVDNIIDWIIFSRQGTYWRNTMVTAGVINAMADYLLISDELDPDYSLKVSVNGKDIFDKQITKEDVFAASQKVLIPGKELRNGINDIRIEKSGAGKVYFTSTTSYYGTNYMVKEGGNGFNVDREYFKLVQTEDEEGNLVYKKEKITNGSVTSGDVILVKTTVQNLISERQYLLLEDPIPAGCEVLNDDEAGGYEIINESNYNGYGFYSWGWWYADKEIRDNKVSFFSRRLWGKQEFTYLLRAQIPGEFYVNPSRVSLMYYPQINGNSGNFVMKIRDRKRN